MKFVWFISIIENLLRVVIIYLNYNERVKITTLYKIIFKTVVTLRNA